MALKATVFKATLQLADMDRSRYGELAVTLARHPSETDERMMVRLLAYALAAPADADNGALAFAKGLWDPDEPELWQKDLTGRIVHWIDIGQPDERRILRASGRAERVSVFSHAASTPIWWSGLGAKLTRAHNIAVWQIPNAQAQALATLATRGMQLQVSVQDGLVWVGDAERSVEIEPVRLNP